MDPNTTREDELATAVEQLLSSEHAGLDALAASLSGRPGPGIAHAAVGEWLGPALGRKRRQALQ